MREEEEFCKESFNNYLVNKLGFRPTNWKEGDDPPDYYFTLDVQKYMVEVTSIMLEVVSDSITLEEKKFESSIDDLVEEIKKDANNKGILKGTYVMSFFGPFRNFAKVKRKIKKPTLKYIEKTQGKNKESWHTLYQLAERNCAICKTGISSDFIAHGVTSPEFYMRWTELIKPEACKLLKKEAKGKMLYLREEKVPRILLLLNYFRHSELIKSVYKNCKLEPEVLDFYHSIFIVEADGSGYFIHSKEESWM